MPIDVKKQINYWLTTAKSDLETAHDILKAGKNYHHCCFFCHLVVEKHIKALIVKVTKEIPPYSHDLIYLTEKAQLSIDEEMKNFFEMLNRFVIEARYPDEQGKLYKLATRKFTQTCLKKTEHYIAILKKLAKQ